MRKLLLLLMFVPVLCQAQTEEECFNYIKKYDVAKEVMALPNDNRANFWWQLPKYNKEYQKFETALKNGKETAKSAVSEINRDLLLRGDEIQNVLNDSVSLAIVDSVSRFFNIGAYNRQMKIHVVNYKEANAGTTPDGIMLISKGLLSKDSLTWEELFAVVGHELAHNALGHSLVNVYAIKKKEKRNQAWTGVAYGLEAAGNAVLEASVINNSKEAQQRSAQRLESIRDNFDRNLEWATVDAYGRFNLKYSRRQEIEADIASYRYMQWIGEDPTCVIDMLELLAKDEPEFDVKKSDHPSSKYRANVLKAIAKYDEANKNK